MEQVPEISCYSKVQHKHLKEKLPEPIRNHQSAKRPTAALSKEINWGGGKKKKSEKNSNSYKQVSDRKSSRKKGQEREKRIWVH